MQNKVQDGWCIDCTAAEDVNGGGLIVLGGMVAVAFTNIPKGETGACEATGVFELPNVAGTAIKQGDKVYAKAEGSITTTATGNTYAGVAWEAAAANAPTVLVKINA